MYYRRKILLSLLQVFDNRLDKIRLQKLLFLLVRQQSEKSFHFIPHKYGCFSYQADADLRTLIKYSFVTDTIDSWEKVDKEDYLVKLEDVDQTAIRFIKKQYGNLNKQDLIELTYKNYPYFAINSVIASEILSEDDLLRIQKQIPLKNEVVLFTIGYEGISLEEYLNKLIINNIRILCDVRKNALSRKFGFSKKQLQKACNDIGIEYIHFPELGIESEKRRVLNTQSDYDELFKQYKRSTLKLTLEKQREVAKILENNKRIALTCFEANVHQCHRKPLADSLAILDGANYKLKHLA